MLYSRLRSILNTSSNYVWPDVSMALFLVVTTEDSAIFASRYEA